MMMTMMIQHGHFLPKSCRPCIPAPMRPWTRGLTLPCQTNPATDPRLFDTSFVGGHERHVFAWAAFCELSIRDVVTSKQSDMTWWPATRSTSSGVGRKWRKYHRAGYCWDHCLDLVVASRWSCC